jgi:hypothetical protein
VPDALRTEELCTMAVAQHGLAFWDVPKPLRSDKLREIARRSVEHLKREEMVEHLKREEMRDTIMTPDGGSDASAPEVLTDGRGDFTERRDPVWHLPLLDELAAVLSDQASRDLPAEPQA